jgi:hypothetical protein
VILGVGVREFLNFKHVLDDFNVLRERERQGERLII